MAIFKIGSRLIRGQNKYRLKDVLLALLEHYSLSDMHAMLDLYSL